MRAQIMLGISAMCALVLTPAFGNLVMKEILEASSLEDFIKERDFVMVDLRTVVPALQSP